MRRLLVLSAVLGVMPVSYAADPGANGSLLNGDTNCDGDRDLSDAILLLNWLYMGGGRPCPLADPPHLTQRIEELEGQLAERDAELAQVNAQLEDKPRPTWPGWRLS